MTNFIPVRSSAFGFLCFAAIAFACSPEESESPDGGVGGAGGQDNGAETATGGKGPGSGGGGLGGGDTGGTGGDTDGAAGAGGEASSEVCAPAPAGLLFFFNQTPYENPLGNQAFLVPELAQGRDATVEASEYGIVEGPVDQAIDFGEDIAVTLEGPTETVGAPWPATTLEFWVETTDSNVNLVSFQSIDAPGDAFWTTELGTDGRLDVSLEKVDHDGAGSEDFGGLFTIYSLSALNDGAPHHVVIVHDFSVAHVRVYIDGALESTGALAEGSGVGQEVVESAHRAMVGASTHPLVIGGDRTGHFFEGRVDEVSLYVTKLDASTIEALYEAGSAGKCLD